MNDKEASKRSPNYPSTSLEDAVNHMRTIYDKDKLAAASAEVLVSHLGYNKLHGTSRRVLSSIRQYGLLDEVSDQRYKVSESAYRLLNADKHSPKETELLKEAALKPIIFRNILEEYEGELPSEKTLSSYLVLEKGFTVDGASSFVKVLQDNVEYANITISDFTENTGENTSFQEGVNMTGQQKQQTNQGQISPVASAISAAQNLGLPTPDTKETILNFKISRKSEARIIFYGEDVTQEAIEQLKKILDAQKDVYPTQKELEDERNQPKSAMWKNKDYDQPIKITGELGEKDGKKFYAVEGSNTGISEDELDFENAK